MTVAVLAGAGCPRTAGIGGRSPAASPGLYALLGALQCALEASRQTSEVSRHLTRDARLVASPSAGQCLPYEAWLRRLQEAFGRRGFSPDPTAPSYTGLCPLSTCVELVRTRPCASGPGVCQVRDFVRVCVVTQITRASCDSFVLAQLAQYRLDGATETPSTRGEEYAALMRGVHAALDEDPAGP